MSDFTMPLMLDLDVVSLTMSLVNIPSESGAADGLADSIEAALSPVSHLSVERVGNTVIARTPEPGASGDRVLVAGQISTAGGDPDAFAYVEMGKLFGPGACDSKGALAVALRAAVAVARPGVTFVLHDGLAALANARPDLLSGDVAILLAPTAGGVAVAQPAPPGLAALAALADTSGLPASPPRQAEVDLLVARGIPTAAFGPGDPAVARTPGEFVPTAALTECEYVLRTWLQGAARD